MRLLSDATYIILLYEWSFRLSLI